MKKIVKKIFKTSILGIIMAVVFVASYVFASIPFAYLLTLHKRHKLIMNFF